MGGGLFCEVSTDESKQIDYSIFGGKQRAASIQMTVTATSSIPVANVDVTEADDAQIERISRRNSMKRNNTLDLLIKLGTDYIFWIRIFIVILGIVLFVLACILRFECDKSISKY